MTTRKSPNKQQQRLKNSHSNPTGFNYSKTSPTRPLSTGSQPAVPIFYTTSYADPPECSLLPPPPESWYMTSIVETPVEEKPKLAPVIEQRPRSHHRNRGSYRPFPAPLISVRA